MTTQTIQFDAVSLTDIGSGTITAQLLDGDSNPMLAAIAESAVRGRYTGTVTDHVAGSFELLIFWGGKRVGRYSTVPLLAADGTYVAKDTVDAVLDTDAQAMVAAFNAMRSGNVFTAPALANAPGGAGGGWTADQIAQVARIESQTAKLSGSPVTVNGNVKPGGQIVVTQGDDHTVALGNPIIVPVDDVGGALHTLMAAVGVGNLSVVAIRGVDPASRVSGTVAALSYASNVLSVTLQFTATETAKGVVGPAYNYDVIKTDTPTRTYFSGRLTVARNAR